MHLTRVYTTFMFTNLLSYFRVINLSVIVAKLYPFARLAIEEAKQLGSVDGWTGAEKKAFAIKMTLELAEATGIRIPERIEAQLPEIIEVVYNLVFKKV